MPGSTAPRADGPEISVVVSTLGNYDVLRRVLDGFSRQRAAPDSFEVLVVIDRADPRPEDVVEAIGARPYPIRRLVGERPGLSANRNAGVRAARAPLVLFTDNDTIPVRRLVSEHLAWHSRHPEPEVAVVGHVRWARGLRVTSFMHWLDHGVQFQYPQIQGVDAGWGRFYGANVSVKRDFAQRVGDFDEKRLPFGYEDLDWAARASKLGLRVLYARRAVVDHLRPMTLEFWKKRVRRIAAAERAFVAIHPELEPYFHAKFSSALRWGPSSGRGVWLARWVPQWVPWLGPRAWRSRDIYFRQALAPHFLEAWEAAGAADAGPAQPDLSELEESSAGS